MKQPLRVGLVVPHMFMHRDILPNVIFSPGKLALDLAAGLQKQGLSVTLFTPGPINTTVPNTAADLTYFEQELATRGDGYFDLLKKHPFTFITLARQVQSQLIAQAYAAANANQLDIVHIYTNEEDTALPFAQFCSRPVVFTHHDPFNFLTKYRHVFPGYKHLNWLSMSMAQRSGMPPDTHWLANIYHGLPAQLYTPHYQPVDNYIAFLGRIIEPKGVHLAIRAVQRYNAKAAYPLRLKIAGKHYADHTKDRYWHTHVKPHIDGHTVEYLGFLQDPVAKQQLLGNARALIVPSTFNEPFGMVMIEALACGTPIVGLDSGAIPEVVRPGTTGYIVPKSFITEPQKSPILDDEATASGLASALIAVQHVDRHACRKDFEERFTLERMCYEHALVYKKLAEL